MSFSSFFKNFKKGMHEFGENIALIVNSLLLLIVYIIGVGMTSLISRLFGKKFMDTKLSRTKKSYWTDLKLSKKPIEEYYKQF